MLTRLPILGNQYEIVISYKGSDVSLMEPENVTERPIQNVVDRKPLTRGGRISRRVTTQGFEINCEGAKIDSKLAVLLSVEDNLNANGEYIDPEDITVMVKVMGNDIKGVNEETLYSHCVLSEPERTVAGLNEPIQDKLKITAMYKKSTFESQKISERRT